jgi:hypothetical protein
MSSYRHEYCKACPTHHSEVQCCQNNGSKCCNTNKNCCCTALGGIANVDQGFFQNVGSKKVINIPSVDLAYITNCENNNDIDVTINLNPTYLTWCDFSLLFFRTPGGSFYINNSNATVSAIAFNDQTYETTQNKKVGFSLYDQILKAWSKKTNKPESTIPIPYRIQLERQSFLTKSLASINCYQLGLSLDEVISTLISKKEIEPADPDSFATVKFNISYRDYFCPLDVSLLTVFTFVTNIPCYKNVTDCSLCPYSADTAPSRKVFEYDDNASYASYEVNESAAEKSVFSAQNTEFYLDDASSQGDVHSEIKKILTSDSSVAQNSVSWN